MAKVDIMEIEKIDRDRKTGDNMDGEKRANDKLEMMTADLSNRLNTKEINELIRKSRSGDDMNKLLKGKGLTLKEIKQLEKIILKRN
tara:strand:+ start:207 stop:467 length:261 start_codon:yes stop_codon:yes gene_type:complete